MKAICTLACATLLIGACSGPSHEAEDAVRQLLYDPESARFTEVQVAGAGNVCGYVNAKNKMGGYVGKTPFYYVRSNGETAVLAPVEESDFRSLWWAIESRSDDEKFSEIRARCRGISAWRDICGFEYPARAHDLCDAILGSGSGLYLTLEKRFRR
jgi:hypothetical protein